VTGTTPAAKAKAAATKKAAPVAKTKKAATTKTTKAATAKAGTKVGCVLWLLFYI
jgi:hypothetical protein